MLISIGLLFYFLGILWFLDRGFLCIGNVSLSKFTHVFQFALIMGIVALVGFKQTMVFFGRKSKIFGSILFFAGFALITMGWFMFTTVGFFMQVYGLFLLFKQFISTIFSFMQTLPVIGPCLRNTPFLHYYVNKLSENSSGRAKKYDV